MTFEGFVTEQGQSLLRLAYVLTSDAHRAEDLTQTVLADVYRHRRKVLSAKDSGAYARRMMVNAHLDWHRRRSSSESPTDFRTWEAGWCPDPAEAIASRDQLKQALATLAPRARTALVLRYYADMDDNAIADAMDITASAVRASISRALAALRTDSVLDVTKETS